MMFLSLGLPGAGMDGVPCCLSHCFCCYLHGFNRFLVFTDGSSLFFAVIYMGFKELLFFLFDSIALGEYDLQKLK